MAFSLFSPSTAVMQANVDSRLATLTGLLPPSASPRLSTATQDLQPLSVLPNIGGGSFILVMRHAELDPQLAGWMDGIRQKCSGIVDLRERAGAVFNHVSRTFSPARNALFHPIARWREAKWEKEPMVCLGMLVAHGVGACLPQSAALHLAFQAASVPSKIVMGRMKEVCLDNEVRGEVYGEGPHAWVETGYGDGSRFLYDPSQQLRIEHMPNDPRRPRTPLPVAAPSDPPHSENNPQRFFVQSNRRRDEKVFRGMGLRARD